MNTQRLVSSLIPEDGVEGTTNWRQPKNAHSPREESRGLRVIKWLEVLRTALDRQETVCEFIIFSNRLAASCSTVLAQ
jgi:hypothetical protein